MRTKPHNNDVGGRTLLSFTQKQLLLKGIGKKLIRSLGRVYFFLFFLFSLQGCFTIFPMKKAEYPADWIREIAPSGPTWRVIGMGKCNKTKENKMIPSEGFRDISISIYNSADWVVKTAFGIDVWIYERGGKGRKLLSGVSARKEIKNLNKELSNKMFDTQEVLQIIYYSGPFPRRPLVIINLEQIFRDHPWCSTIWLDDGIKGMCYDPKKLYSRMKDPVHSIGRDSGGAGCRLVKIEASDYNTLNRLIKKYRKQRKDADLFKPSF